MNIEITSDVQTRLTSAQQMISISRTIASDQLVDEMVFKFTQTVRMDWMLPGLVPTGKRFEVPLVAIRSF